MSKKRSQLHVTTECGPKEKEPLSTGIALYSLACDIHVLFCCDCVPSNNAAKRWPRSLQHLPSTRMPSSQMVATRSPMLSPPLHLLLLPHPMHRSSLHILLLPHPLRSMLSHMPLRRLALMAVLQSPGPRGRSRFQQVLLYIV